MAPFGQRRTVDLERTRVMELSPRRGWQQFSVKWHDKITLKPGEMVLGRVAERFQMPSDCAGAIEGRSSYARLGLSIHTAGGFINPGWKGHMPLTLYNHSPVTLKIPVGTPLCQLLVVGLSEAPEADYASRSDRKYVNDQGGPSYWWRDEIMREIRRKFASVNLDARAFDELDELMVNTADEAVLGRLEDFLSRQGDRNYGNAEELLTEFAAAERRHKRSQAIALNIGRGAWTVAGGFLASLWLVDSPALWLWIIAWALTFVGLLGLVWGATNSVQYHLTPDELDRLRLERDRRRQG
jgi:deoxycytidine triphosphate deaminase